MSASISRGAQVVQVILNITTVIELINESASYDFWPDAVLIIVIPIIVMLYMLRLCQCPKGHAWRIQN